MKTSKALKVITLALLIVTGCIVLAFADTGVEVPLLHIFGSGSGFEVPAEAVEAYSVMSRQMPVCW